MNHRILSGAMIALPLSLGLLGCEARKSSTPLSPTVAGPIAGVNITPVNLLEPSPSFRFRSTDQPIRLVVENAASNGQRPLSYTFEVATDDSFATKAYARSGVPPGENGRTSVVLDGLESGRQYFWRARAEDGANTGPFASAQFEVLPKPFLDRPQPLSPINGEVASDRRPTLRVGNANRNAAIDQLTYLFQIAKDQTFVQIVAEGTASEGSGDTAWQADRDLDANLMHFWRTRASDGVTVGDWSDIHSFKTPSTSGGGGGGGGGGGNSACAPPYPNNGKALVDCIERKYPERLAAGVSLDQRKANMAFLRDRMIEVGICGGMRLGWNMKRGGPEKSIDFLAWHDGQQWIGVDIGRAYDDPTRVLDLVWGIYGPTPHAAEYSPRPVCQ